MAIPGQPNLVWLDLMVALILILTWGCGVEGMNFTFNGFEGLSDVYTVLGGGAWTYSPNDSSIYYVQSVSSRILYPGLVQMKDPLTMTVKSFSCNFIFQIFNSDTDYGTGPGMTFMMVPDNMTLGNGADYMGLITMNTSSLAENYLSDNHTFAIEIDTNQNPEFNDPNNNHIGIDLTNMNSTGGAFTPTFSLTTTTQTLYLQVWIDYFQANSSINIYITEYGQDKPTTPFTSPERIDLSILNDYMYIGFSTASYSSESYNVAKVLAWSFSTDGPAPEIWIAQDAPPPSSPPPPAPLSPPPPVPPPPSAPAPPHSPVAAPNPAPNASPPPSPPSSPPLSPPPSPRVATPSPAPTMNASSPPVPAPNTPPIPPPSPPPPGPVPSPAPSNELIGSQAKPTPVGLILAIVFSILGGIVVMALCWIFIRITSHPIHFFLVHSSGKGKDEVGKNFTALLYKEMKSTWRYNFNLIKVFFDRESIPRGSDFPQHIQRELDRTQVGVIIITEDFFMKRWPMTELLSLVDSIAKNPDGVRILPLFYRLRADEVRERLREKSWDIVWTQMSTDRHPIHVEDCRNAVDKLCNLYGLEYPYSDLGLDLEYIKLILKQVVLISDELRRKLRPQGSS